ncbi:1007_t:CDS:2, partial [Scutellospora calospora]
KEVVQGIKNVIDNWLYPNDKIYKQAIRKELEALCPNKMSRTESCKYCKALFGSFRCAIFDHVFKKEVSPTVNSESSESEIISWMASEE